MYFLDIVSIFVFSSNLQTVFLKTSELILAEYFLHYPCNCFSKWHHHVHHTNIVQDLSHLGVSYAYYVIKKTVKSHDIKSNLLTLYRNCSSYILHCNFTTHASEWHVFFSAIKRMNLKCKINHLTKCNIIYYLKINVLFINTRYIIIIVESWLFVNIIEVSKSNFE
jgi:hypothetical protein